MLSVVLIAARLRYRPEGAAISGSACYSSGEERSSGPGAVGMTPSVFLPWGFMRYRSFLCGSKSNVCTCRRENSNSPPPHFRPLEFSQRVDQFLPGPDEGFKVLINAFTGHLES